MFGMGGLGELVVSIGTDLTKLDKGLKTASLKITSASKKMASSLDQVGRKMTMFGAMTTAGFVAAVIPAIKFEDAFAGVRKTVDATEEEFKKLEKNLLDLSKVIPTTAVELARIGEVAGQLGIRGVKNITKFTKTIAQIEASTSLSADIASVNLARIAGIMEEPIQNIDRMGSSIVDLGNKYRTNESEIVNFTMRIASAGKRAKMTTQDIFGISAAFASVGIQAEAGGTSIQKVINAMTKAVATGNEELSLFADVVDLTTEEFQELYESNPAEAFTLFVEGLKKAGDESFDILENLGLANERVDRSFFSLAESGNLLRDTLETSGKAFEENTALQEEYDKRLKTTATQLKILKNNIIFAAITLGDTLLPVINKLIKGYLIPVVSKLANWIKKNEDLVKQITLVVGAVGAFSLVAGPLLIILGNLVLVIGGVASAFILLLSPMTLVVSGLVAFSVAWIMNWRGIRDDTFNIIRQIKGDFHNLGRSLTYAAVGIGESLKGMWKGEKDVIQTVIEGWRKAGNVIADLDAGHKEIDETLGENPGLDVFEKKINILVKKLNSGKDAFDALITSLVTPPEPEPKEEEISEDKKEDKTDSYLPEPKNVKTRMGILEKLKKTFDFKWLKTEKTKIMTLQELHTSNYGQLKSILQQQAADSKVAAGLLKAMAIGEAIVNTSRGVAAALATPPPMSYVWASITAALGAAEVATIAGVGFAEGTDSVPSMLSPGEMVIPNSFADAIRNGNLSLSGGESGASKHISVYNSFEFDNITITDERDIEELAEELGDNIENKIRSV